MKLRYSFFSVDKNKASDPDKSSNKFVKLTVESLSLALTYLFNTSLHECIFPTIWKEASVFPLHKKGSINEYHSYSPVVLRSCIGKIFEKWVFEYVFNFLQDNNVSTNLSWIKCLNRIFHAVMWERIEMLKGEHCRIWFYSVECWYVGNERSDIFCSSTIPHRVQMTS